MWGLPQKQNARRADKIRLCGHLRRYKKIVKKTYIIYAELLLVFIFVAILSLTYIFPCNIGPWTNSQSKIFNQLIENVTEVELQRLKTSNQLQKGIPWGTFNHLVFALGIGYAAAMAVQTGIRRRWKRLPQYKADVATGIKKKEISGGSVSS